MSATTHRLIALALALLVGACGDGDDGASPAPTATPTSTTVAPASTLTTEVETPYAEWLAARSDGMVFGVWVEVRGGLVEAVDEQWVP